MAFNQGVYFQHRRHPLRRLFISSGGALLARAHTHTHTLALSLSITHTNRDFISRRQRKWETHHTRTGANSNNRIWRVMACLCVPYNYIYVAHRTARRELSAFWAVAKCQCQEKAKWLWWNGTSPHWRSYRRPSWLMERAADHVRRPSNNSTTGPKQGVQLAIRLFDREETDWRRLNRTQNYVVANVQEHSHCPTVVQWCSSSSSEGVAGRETNGPVSQD